MTPTFSWRLPNGWPAWSLLIVAAVMPLNLLGIWVLAGSWQVGVAPDFQQYADALARLLAGDPLYGPDWKWRYSPAALLTMAPALATGLVGWTILHVVALGLIRPLWLAALVAVSWPFWVDVVAGNTVTFVMVAGIAAMRGSTTGTYAYWWLAMTIPRPMQLPLAIYLVWRRRDLWRGLLVMAIVHLAIVLVVGQGREWITYLLERGAENTALAFNIHPFADLGWAWLLAGAPAAAVIAMLGWPGVAGVVLWPSLLAQYLLMAFVPPGPRLRRWRR